MKKRIKISHSEWLVMGVIWEKAPVAASQVVDGLREQKNWALATVRTLLRRLVRKGAVSQELDGRRYLYSPRVTAEECLREESETLLGRMLALSSGATILHLVERADLSREDIKELQRILRRKDSK